MSGDVPVREVYAAFRRRRCRIGAARTCVNEGRCWGSRLRCGVWLAIVGFDVVRGGIIPAAEWILAFPKGAAGKILGFLPHRILVRGLFAMYNVFPWSCPCSPAYHA